MHIGHLDTLKELDSIPFQSNIPEKTTGPNCYQCLTILKTGFSSDDPRHAILGLNPDLPMTSKIELLLDFPFIQRYQNLTIDLPTLQKISKMSIPNIHFDNDRVKILQNLMSAFFIDMGTDPAVAVEYLSSLSSFPRIFSTFYDTFPELFDDYDLSLIAVKFFFSAWRADIFDYRLPSCCVSREALFYILSEPYQERIKTSLLKGVKRYFDFITLESDPKYLHEYSVDWFALWYSRNVHEDHDYYRNVFLTHCIEELVVESQTITHISSLKLEIGMKICGIYSHLELETLLDDPEREEFTEGLQNTIATTRDTLLELLHNKNIECASLISDFVLGEPFVSLRRRVITEMDITRHQSWDQFFDKHDIKR